MSDHFPELPDSLPKAGLILDNQQEKRLGVWIMPDNNSRGMMETFLSTLVTDEKGRNLLEYSKEVVANEKVNLFSAIHGPTQ
ncbi:hypothetical protein B1A_08755 [mine drainage metagenome]|uniref:Uncharacterized protein n=1 Tax=mine drainage metagenome TaxID=410659 RepID=T1CD75_9ZZZZ